MAEEVGIQVRAYDKASGVLNHVSGRLGILNKQGLMMGVAFAGVTMGVQALMSALQGVKQWLGESIKKFREFERAMSEVATMLVGMDQDYLPAMTDAINEMSIAFAKGAIDLSQGLYQILSAGIDASAGIDVLRVSAKLATVSLTAVEVAVDAVTTVLNAYGMSAIQAEHVSNILWKSVQLGKQRLDDIAGAIGYIVPMASKANIAFEEMAAAMATLTKQGLDAHKASRGLRMTIANLITPTEEAITAMVELGIAYDELTIEAMGLAGTLNMINDATEGSITKMSQFIGNVQALTSALGLMGDQADMFAASLEYIESDIDALNEAYSDIANTTDFLRRRQEMLSDTIDRSVGEAIEPADRAWADFVNALKIGATDTYAPLFGLFGILKSGYDNLEELNAEAQTFTEEALDTEKVDLYAASFERWGKGIEDGINLVGRMTIQQELYNQQISDLKDQKAILEQTHEYREALHYIPLALEQATYTNKIYDESTRALVDSIRIQREQIEGLTRANRQYSMEVQANSIAEMKIQLAAGKTRGRLTRSQKNQLREINQANLETRIKMMENELAIGEIREGGLTEEEERLQRWQTATQEAIREIQDGYERELASLDTQIKYKEMLHKNYTGYITDLQTDLYNSWAKYYEELGKLDSAFQKAITGGEGYKAPERPVFGAGGLTDAELAAILGVETGWTGSRRGLAVDPSAWEGHQFGIPHVGKTGLYKLHEGNIVLPSSNTKRGMSATISFDSPIHISVTVYNHADLISVGDQVGKLISAGILDGLTSEFQVG